MATCPYQPVTTGGLLGSLARLFGSTTPAYRGVGQPAPSGGGMFGSIFGGTPVYRTGAPTPTDEPPLQRDTDPSSGSPDGQSSPLTIVIQRD